MVRSPVEAMTGAEKGTFHACSARRLRIMIVVLFGCQIDGRLATELRRWDGRIRKSRNGRRAEKGSRKGDNLLFRRGLSWSAAGAEGGF